jgi:hypothetical protein
VVQELGAVVVDVDGQYVSGPVVMESSADGLLVLEVDYNGGEVRVQLEPEILRSWSADLLAERIMRLHRLALMRARAEKRVRDMAESGVVLPTTPGWPSPSDVEAYRRTIDF